jgi:hypothetical protein
MALAAIIASVVATLIALASLWYAHRADQRAGRAEQRDETRLAGERASTRVVELERIGEMMRETAAAVRNPLDPESPRQVRTGLARLETAITLARVDLPACSDYASNADANKLPAAERELEQAIANARSKEVTNG